ncbi:hypothetical protein JTE90_011294 [Oedothorax gibbosus]|uniref:Uncharacterized protein n=1 Tax=Oedothorax gibbosus TaxID=931172 RepID=A0AAV6VN27_9ARAC|nr:hypothetical protein JTE90_011294 [Oedothorax gibbosus]
MKETKVYFRSFLTTTLSQSVSARDHQGKVGESVVVKKGQGRDKLNPSTKKKTYQQLPKHLWHVLLLKGLTVSEAEYVPMLFGGLGLGHWHNLPTTRKDWDVFL